MTEIRNAYYTNDRQDDIAVTYYSEADGTYVMHIEPGSNEAIELTEAGWTKDVLVDATGEYKRQQRVEIVDIAVRSARSEYEAEIDAQQHRLKRHQLKTVQAEALAKASEAEFAEQLKKQRAKIVESEALANEKEKQLKETSERIEDFLKSTLSTEDIEAGFDKTIAFLKGVNKKYTIKRLKEAKVI